MNIFTTQKTLNLNLHFHSKQNPTFYFAYPCCLVKDPRTIKLLRVWWKVYLYLLVWWRWACGRPVDMLKRVACCFVFILSPAKPGHFPRWSVGAWSGAEPVVGGVLLWVFLFDFWVKFWCLKIVGAWQIFVGRFLIMILNWLQQGKVNSVAF